jgi:AraC-like DNA-binding protein
MQLCYFILDKASDNILSLDNEGTNIMKSMIQMLLSLTNTRIPSSKTIGNFISAIIYFAESILDAQKQKNTGCITRDQDLFDKFIKLLNKHAEKERSLEFYADKLFVTRNYLSIVISRYSGVTSMEWIDRAVIMEAKVMLRHSTLPITEIAEMLNFPSDSSFSKYFRRITKMTPLAYRNS